MTRHKVNNIWTYKATPRRAE